LQEAVFLTQKVKKGREKSKRKRKKLKQLLRERESIIG
jgi:hypothetical protein